MMKNPDEDLENLPENVFIDTAMSAELEEAGEFEKIVRQFGTKAGALRLRFSLWQPESRNREDQGQQLFGQRKGRHAVEKRGEDFEGSGKTAGEY